MMLLYWNSSTNIEDACKTGKLLRCQMQFVNVYKSHTILFNFGKVIKGYI